MVKAFRRFGGEVVRQESSHVVMVQEGQPATLSIPDYNPGAKETLRSLIRSTGLTVEKFVAALGSRKYSSRKAA